MTQATGQGLNEASGSQSDLQQILKQADTDFDQSQQELYRPSTDVVLYSACFYARRALHQYLYFCYRKFGGQLESGKTLHDLTIDQMAEYCGKYDKRIANIDFKAMHCRKVDVLDDEDIFYCNDVNTVSSCKNLSEQMRELVHEIA
ncbi:MAG: hypothetical protein WD097_01495 [Balneolales bacterium]